MVMNGQHNTLATGRGFPPWGFRGPSALACISHHPTVEAHEKKAVIRVSCLVIRESHGRGLGSLQKKCLTACER